jgi:uncharacterized protein (DUF58 family)
MKTTMKNQPNSLRTRVQHWLTPKQKAESGEVYLRQRRVYIMPSAAGFLYTAMLALLLVASINYNLSLGFGLTFLMAACGVVDIHLAFRNLAFLHLSSGRTASVFAGEQASFEVHIMNRRTYDRFALWLQFMNDPHSPAQACDVAGKSRETITLSTPAVKRGWLPAPRIRLQAYFPLGLLRTWAYWQPDMRVLVYPFPEVDGPALPLPSLQRSSGKGGNVGHDDFAGVRHYQPGDVLKHLAWRQIARLPPELGGQLLSKHFEGGGENDLLLDFDQLSPHIPLEDRISRMTRWVLEAERQALPYAFHLATHRFDSALGEAHLSACLEALALHQLPNE